MVIMCFGYPGVEMDVMVVLLLILKNEFLGDAA
jgi:hypothetical protein